MRSASKFEHLNMTCESSNMGRAKLHLDRSKRTSYDGVDLRNIVLRTCSEAVEEHSKAEVQFEKA